jgi:VIT1/CCC1 family predicted Fe2+/Mn2+ transporter
VSQPIAQKTSWLRGVVMGLDDGLVTTLVAIMMLSGVAGPRLLYAMIGVVLASAISMTIGGCMSALVARDRNPIAQGLQTGGAFIIGGLAPLLPVVLHLPLVQWWSYGCAVLVALGFALLKARYSEEIHDSLRFALLFLAGVTVGTLAGVVIGWFLP